MRTVTILILGGLAACAGSDDATSTEPTPASTTVPAQQTATPSAAVAAAAGAGAVTAPSVMPVQSSPASVTPQPAAASTPSASAVPGAATTPTATTPAGATTPGTAAPADSMKPKLAMDECGLHTKYPGDEYCIKAPPEDKGFQFHIGPKDYDNPEPQFVLQPGEENVISMDQVSGNKTDIYYYYRQYRMRPGSHHVILNSGDGRRLGGTQNLSKDNPDNGIIPPENADVGLPLAANTQISANMHFYNFGEKPILRELWVNFWYKDASTVKRPTTEVWSPTGVSAAVAHSHVVVGASCQVPGDGRLLTLYGHRHMSNVRFSAWRKRGGMKDLILEDYDPKHPEVLEYNSLATNPKPDPVNKTAGGWSGVLDLKAGDTIDYECEIVNMTDKNFFGANEADDDEMCIITGDAVGTTIPTYCTATPSRKVN
jgi:hypothetical protein